jgi:glycosyltransferase involved in cell wall biosynthesis
MTKVTIIIPTRNEEQYIEKCIRSVLDFENINESEHEILVIDGRSSDNTREIVNTRFGAYPQIRLIDNPGIIQSYALNIGIKQAIGDFIMRLDAHCIYPPDYLKKLTETAIRTNADNTGGMIVTHPGGPSYGAELVQALTTHRFGVGNSGFRTGAKEGPADTVPFGFFKKEVFDRIGFFNEKLIRCQDYELNCRMIKNNLKIWMNPEIISHYFNQPDLFSFLKKQLFKEAPYNPYMWYLAPYTFTMRHAVTGIFAVSFIAGLILSFIFTWAKILFAGVMLLYLTLGVLSAFQQAIRYKKTLHILTLPLSFFLYHFIHGTGILTGIFKLILRISPVQQRRELKSKS